MKNKPLISVITPVYKVEAYLDHCVQSILRQTYENLELILVDDGSPDRSGAICDAWAERDPRVKVIHQENGGGGKARNTALDAATGELIAFVDSDDYLSPDMFSYLYTLLEMGADVAECGYVDALDDNAVFGGGENLQICSREEAMREHIQDTHFRQLIWNKLYRREVVGSVRFPVGTKIDDEYFTYQLLGNARTLIRSDKVCYAYRQQASSVMHQAFSLKRVEALEAKQQRLAWMQVHIPSLVDAAREDLILTCVYVMQSSLRSLKGQEFQTAKSIMEAAMASAQPYTPSRELSKLRRILLGLAQKNLVLAARLLNFLIDIHILT